MLSVKILRTKTECYKTDKNKSLKIFCSKFKKKMRIAATCLIIYCVYCNPFEVTTTCLSECKKDVSIKNLVIKTFEKNNNFIFEVV